ncbi:MAG: hypothetical protein WEC00_07975 [Dongiaceae bacterium]
MTKVLMIAMASVLAMSASTAALADSSNDGPRTLTEIFMGQSNHAPPNANAAASEGTRTEVTTWPRRRHGDWDHGWGHDGNGDWNRGNGTTVITDLPGKKR